MPRLSAKQSPPPDYYAANLRQMLGHVHARHADLLGPAEEKFVQATLAASPAAQRLLARLLSRSGPWVRVDKLNYLEVPDTHVAVAELADAGLVRVNPPAPADALLGLFTQSERRERFPRIQISSRPYTKTQFIRRCVGEYPDDLIAKRIGRSCSWLAIANFSAFHRLQLLFFGDPYQQLSAFVLQDLGVRRYETYPLCETTRQFPDSSAFARYQRVLALDVLARRVDEVPGLAENLLAQLERLTPLTRSERRRVDKIRNRLGRWFERHEQRCLALRCYQESRRHPARERRARIHQRRGDETALQELVQQMLVEPWCAEEQIYAQRLTEGLWSPPTSEFAIAKLPSRGIEAYVGRALVDAGVAQNIWHVENAFSLGLAGLAYWPVVFASVPGAFVNHFQSCPVDLFWDDFLAARQQQLNARQTVLEADFRHALCSTYRAKQGVSNRLVNWSRFGPDLLDAVLAHVSVAQLSLLARHTIEALPTTKVGFPDLLAIGPDGCEFIEVKAPGDQLQPAQRVWLATLQRLGFRARVLRVVV